ncbi:MAG: phasin family protein [Limnohabitans sp.]|jgi:phasin family protein|nr:phasin family protein [Betaproteobacteria bacterium]
MLTVDQIAASQKAQFDVLFGLTDKAFQGVEKMVELNLAASKAALNESAQHAHALLSVKDAQELVALQTAAVQPLAEKAAAYSRHVYDITTATSAEFTKAFEQQASQAQQAVVGYVDSASKNAPAGTEPVMALFKSSLAASNNAMDSVQKVVKQATEAAQANLQALTTSAVSTAVGATKTASRKR